MIYSERDQFDAVLRSSLFAFTWFVFDLLHPGDRFIPAWHVKAMVRALNEAVAGRTKRLLITVPPRHLKSITASVSLPAYWLGHDPTARIIVASYGADLASKHALISLPKEASWLAAFKNELMAFPNGRRDDQVDSIAQFLEWVSRRYACHRIESARTGVNPLRRNMVRR